MAHEDLGFVEDSAAAAPSDHSDLGFVADGDEDKPGMAVTFRDHAANQALAGYGPQIVGGLTHAALKVDDWMHGTHNADLVPYVKSRDSMISDLSDESKENPITAAAGGVTGAVLGFKGLGMAGKAAGLAAQPATALGRIGQSAAGGAAYGALRNPGDIQDQVSPVQPGARAVGALSGGAFGAALGGAGELAKKFLGGGGPDGGGLSGTLRGYANEKAVKAAVAPNKRAMQEIADKGLTDTLGRSLLDDVGMKPWSTPSSMADTVSGLKDAAGEEVGGLVNSAPNASINAKAIATGIGEQPEVAGLGRIPGMESAAPRAEKMLETLGSHGEDLSLPDALKLRQGIDQSINFAKRDPQALGTQDVLYRMRSGIRDAMNDAVNQANPNGEADALLKANQKYSNFSRLEDYLDQKAGREASNRSISLTDTMAGLTGAAMGHPGAAGKVMGAAAMGGANNLMRRFGDQTLAYGADKAANAIAKIPAFADLIERNPGQATQIINMLLEKTGHSGNPLAPMANGFAAAPAKTEDREPTSQPIAPENAKQNFLQKN